MAHLEHLYYFIAMTIFICCFFASELHGCSRTLSVLFRVLPLLLSFVCCFLHRSITDIHGRCPCYFVSFRCYYHLFAVFCIGVSRIFTDVVRVTPCHSVAIIFCLLFFVHRSITDIHGRCPCYSVPFRCYHILFAVFCIGVSRNNTDVVRVIPCHSVAIIFCLLFFCIGVSRIFTDVVRVIPCHSVAIIFCLLFFASEYHGYSRTLSVLFVPFRCYYH